MKFVAPIVFFLVANYALAQMSIKHIYFENDFSPYDTYHIKSFQLNGTEIKHDFSIRTTLLVNKLKESMKKGGFIVAEDPDFYFTYKMNIDTLPIALQRPEGPHPEDLVADITIEIFDAEYEERLFAGNIYGVLVADKKAGKLIKRIYRKLFRDLEG